MNSGYEINRPRGALKPFTDKFDWVESKINYTNHPAYADLVAGVRFTDFLKSTTYYFSQFILLLAKRLVGYEIIPVESRHPRSFRDLLGFAGAALHNISSRWSARMDTATDSPILEELKKTGIVSATMPELRLVALEAAARTHFDALLVRRGAGVNRREFDESRATADRRDDPALFSLVEDIMRESGLAQAASHYLGRTARLIDINPQINDRSDTFWLDIFPDLDAKPIPNSAYFHCDASGGDLKAIIYMTDVGPDNGPFTYALGSNRRRASRVDDLLREANDHNGLSGTDPAVRKRFAGLPKFLQRKWSFGNDLDDEAQLSKAICAASWQVTASKGSIILFDTKGIHRGGMVEAGERRVLTCVLG